MAISVFQFDLLFRIVGNNGSLNIPDEQVYAIHNLFIQ